MDMTLKRTLSLAPKDFVVQILRQARKGACTSLTTSREPKPPRIRLCHHFNYSSVPQGKEVLRHIFLSLYVCERALIFVIFVCISAPNRHPHISGTCCCEREPYLHSQVLQERQVRGIIDVCVVCICGCACMCVSE